MSDDDEQVAFVSAKLSWTLDLTERERESNVCTQHHQKLILLLGSSSTSSHTPANFIKIAACCKTHSSLHTHPSSSVGSSPCLISGGSEWIAIALQTDTIIKIFCKEHQQIDSWTLHTHPSISNCPNCTLYFDHPER